MVFVLSSYNRHCCGL